MINMKYKIPSKIIARTDRYIIMDNGSSTSPRYWCSDEQGIVSKGRGDTPEQALERFEQEHKLK